MRKVNDSASCPLANTSAGISLISLEESSKDGEENLEGEAQTCLCSALTTTNLTLISTALWVEL